MGAQAWPRTHQFLRQQMAFSITSRPQREKLFSNSFSFRSKVEAAAQECKSNTNPLWAPILWTIKTKSSAAAVPAGHKTPGKHPERAANQLAGCGTTRAETVQAGRRPRPCRWTGGGWQGSKSTLKDWKLRRCEARLQGAHSPCAGREWRPRQKSHQTKIHCTGGMPSRNE